MKKLALIFLSIALPIITISFGLKQTNSDTNIETRKRYNQYCASCHGNELERFAGRHWVFGGTVNEIASTIKLGRPSIGMPDFAKAMSDKEIQQLAEFIVAELPHRSMVADNSSKIDTALFTSEHFSYRLEKVAEGFNIAWGMAFLPTGEMLVTDKQGKLYLIKNAEKINIEGVPSVMLQGQGGLLDVAVHPNFNNNKLIYLAYSEKSGSNGGNTSVIRAVFDGNKLTNIEKIFKVIPSTISGVHFGCRLVFDNNGYLYISVGDRGHKPNAQDLSNHCGKIHRIHSDGRIPADNPFVNTPNAIASIWSYGHRNPQSLFYDLQNNILWENEHGPKGGDELNIIEKGNNYGWPSITFGIDYDGTLISADTAKAGMEQPVFYWIPSIAPSGMTKVGGNIYKGWEGNLLCGSLSFKYLERVVLKNNKVIAREKLLPNIGRVRNVVQGPDGYIYVSVENPGRIYRIVPAGKLYK